MVARKVALATVVWRIARCQKRRSALKVRPGQDDGAIEAEGSRQRQALAVGFPCRPCPEQGQGGRHAPEGAREGADIGEAHEDRRNAHGERAEQQRGNGSGERVGGG
ncbi:MAG: hypothetical protein WDN31_17180 [Hyphomicrobium sp.]